MSELHSKKSRNRICKALVTQPSQEHLHTTTAKQILGQLGHGPFIFHPRASLLAVKVAFFLGDSTAGGTRTRRTLLLVSEQALLAALAGGVCHCGRRRWHGVAVNRHRRGDGRQTLGSPFLILSGQLRSASLCLFRFLGVRSSTFDLESASHAHREEHFHCRTQHSGCTVLLLNNLHQLVYVIVLQKDLMLAKLPSFDPCLFKNCFARRRRIFDYLGPLEGDHLVLLDKLVKLGAECISLPSNLGRLHHARVLELLGDILDEEVVGSLLQIGLDAPDKVRRGAVEFVHQFPQRLLKHRAKRTGCHPSPTTAATTTLAMVPAVKLADADALLVCWGTPLARQRLPRLLQEAKRLEAHAFAGGSVAAAARGVPAAVRRRPRVPVLFLLQLKHRLGQRTPGSTHHVGDGHRRRVAILLEHAIHLVHHLHRIVLDAKHVLSARGNLHKARQVAHVLLELHQTRAVGAARQLGLFVQDGKHPQRASQQQRHLVIVVLEGNVGRGNALFLVLVQLPRENVLVEVVM
eukprot:m.883394 g.883394  ORF g.883394 m.883394 type:complete len:520 (+) comp23606_c2_seq6:862-2421(+)